MSDDNEEKSDGYILLENLLKDMPVIDRFILPDFNDTFPDFNDAFDYLDDFEDRIDDSSLFNPNK